MAIEKELFIPSRIKVNPDIIAATIKILPIMDNLEKLEPVNFMLYGSSITETIRIKMPFEM